MSILEVSNRRMALPSVCFIILVYSFSFVTAQEGPCSTKRGYVIFIEDVPETWPVGTVLSHLEIRGRDSEISLGVAEGDEHFEFDPVTRNMSVVKPLTLTESIPQKSYTVKLSCIIKNVGPVELRVKVIVVDVNNNPPEFQSPVYHVSVNELSPVGTTLPTSIQATDKDIQNKYIEYRILPGPHSEYFSLPQPLGSAAVVLAKMVDFETINSLSFEIIAMDVHPPGGVVGQQNVRFTSTATVSVAVLDGDDLNPVFQKPAYKATVEENANEGTVLTVDPTIHAFDQDTINSSVSYGIIEDGSSENFFKIDSQTAEVSLKTGVISRDSKFSVLLKATQVDNPDRYSSSLLNVVVTKANENPPRFRQSVYSTRIVENIPVNTQVIAVSALDNDEVRSQTRVWNRTK